MPQLKHISHNSLFTLPGEAGCSRLSMTHGTRNYNCETQVYAMPAQGMRVWPTRGKWINWDTEVSLIELTPYDKVMLDGPTIQES